MAQHNPAWVAELPLAMETIYSSSLHVCVSLSLCFNPIPVQGGNVFSQDTESIQEVLVFASGCLLGSTHRGCVRCECVWGRGMYEGVMRGVGGTHCLAHAGVAYLVYAAHEDAAGEEDVEAQVNQHVPTLTANADRSGDTQTHAQFLISHLWICLFVYLMRIAPGRTIKIKWFTHTAWHTEFTWWPFLNRLQRHHVCGTSTSLIIETMRVSDVGGEVVDRTQFHFHKREKQLWKMCVTFTHAGVIL